ncbi:hypothetical protein IAT38_005886 [Cryptococcus sp. DSM 104549]
MPGAVNKSLHSVGQHSPIRTSPRKTSHTSTSATSHLYPTPLSMSPNTTSSITSLHYPPSFETRHSRYPSHHSVHSVHSHHTPYSPYRPGEYSRSERGLASERGKVERKLFADGDEPRDEEQEQDEDEDKLGGDLRGRREGGSSPLAPAFEAKMVLRNGASIDLISWLRTNFHHVPPSHPAHAHSMPLIGIRHLLLERFPRAPEPEELAKAVLAAFPHSQWDYPARGSSEPPTIRGLIWHGKEIGDEGDEMEEVKPTVRGSSQTVGHVRGRLSAGTSKGKQTSRSPTQSTLVSPISSSKRPLPDTPARSVLEEFAEIATLAEKTPVSRTKSLPGEPLAASPDSGMTAIANPFESSMLLKGKRPASQSPELGHRRRASTPDKLHGLLAAAEAVEGSPITSVLGHKRRRTIGTSIGAREFMPPAAKAVPRRAQSSRGTMSPPPRGFSVLGHQAHLPQVSEDNVDYLVPLNDTASADEAGVAEADAASAALHAYRAPTSSTSQSSAISHTLPASTAPSTFNGVAGPGAPRGGGRKVNELPTEGEHPGYDCKPPYPYHEMIRYAIENAPDRRLQLNQIYSTIADRFPFFKTLDEKKTAGWQNSIRHNLSLKKMFVRVNKVDGVPDDSGGKGGWWTVQAGVPDEGRPGRKAKARKAKESAAAAAATGPAGEDMPQQMPFGAAPVTAHALGKENGGGGMGAPGQVLQERWSEGNVVWMEK